MDSKGERRRIDAIDFWRGFVLVSIFVNHVPGNVFERLTHKNIGLSDAAEAFVFLSGISVALAYGRRFLSGEVGAPIRALGRRALTIYGVQVLLSFAAIAFFVTAAILFDDKGLLAEHGRDIILGDPARALIAIVGLSHQLGYFNILPLYIVLLLGTPAILALARVSGVLMLTVSAMVYVGARMMGLNLPTWPVQGGWFFNPFAWQFLYCIGLFIGLHLRDAMEMRDNMLFAACLAILVASFFVLTDGFHLVPGLWEDLRGSIDVGKTNLGLGRLLHFLALTYVLSHIGLTRFLARTPIHAPLCLIGRHSLPVFAAGSLLSALDQIIQHVRPMPIFEEATLVGIGILMHYIVARAFAGRSSRRRIQTGSA
jgi:Uncharacterized protein conserved in bacteria